MRLGIRVEPIWWDNTESFYEVRISCSNGTFSGSADMYVSVGDLVKLASRLQGFPQDPADHRKLTLGSFESESDSGGVELAFRCLDSVGHVAVKAKIRALPSQREVGKECYGPDMQTAEMTIAVEPAAIDRFVEQLRMIESKTRDSATLST
jgi:hypothetical protein